jgi:hypothetical protein
MDENKVHGEARNIVANCRKASAVPWVMPKLRLANQVRGTAQDLYGQARDGAA